MMIMSIDHHHHEETASMEGMEGDEVRYGPMEGWELVPAMPR